MKKSFLIALLTLVGLMVQANVVPKPELNFAPTNSVVSSLLLANPSDGKDYLPLFSGYSSYDEWKKQFMPGGTYKGNASWNEFSTSIKRGVNEFYGGRIGKLNSDQDVKDFLTSLVPLDGYTWKEGELKIGFKDPNTGQILEKGFRASRSHGTVYGKYDDRGLPYPIVLADWDGSTSEICFNTGWANIDYYGIETETVHDTVPVYDTVYVNTETPQEVYQQPGYTYNQSCGCYQPPQGCYDCPVYIPESGFVFWFGFVVEDHETIVDHQTITDYQTYTTYDTSFTTVVDTTHVVVIDTIPYVNNGDSLPPYVDNGDSIPPYVDNGGDPDTIYPGYDDNGRAGDFANLLSHKKELQEAAHNIDINNPQLAEDGIKKDPVKDPGSVQPASVKDNGPSKDAPKEPVAGNLSGGNNPPPIKVLHYYTAPAGVSGTGTPVSFDVGSSKVNTTQNLSGGPSGNGTNSVKGATLPGSTNNTANTAGLSGNGNNGSQGPALPGSQAYYAQFNTPSSNSSNGGLNTGNSNFNNYQSRNNMPSGSNTAYQQQNTGRNGGGGFTPHYQPSQDNRPVYNNPPSRGNAGTSYSAPAPISGPRTFSGAGSPGGSGTMFNRRGGN